MRSFPSFSLVVRLSGPLLVPCFMACSSGGGATSSPEEGAARPVVERYAAVAQKGYAESLAKAKVMKSAIDAFVAAPSQAGLDAARKAWLDARDAYGQTESYRFYDGPIDDERGPEGRVNGWPLDEAFIDYVEGNADAGIVNTAAALPALTKEGLAAENEKGGETNIATGWHAIEFLLWGQDKSETLSIVSKHTRLLHDGRARDVSEAILWHGGEATASREAFRAMPTPDRVALLAFLGSL